MCQPTSLSVAMDMKMLYEIVEWTGMDKSLGFLVNAGQKETVKPISLMISMLNEQLHL